MKILINELSYHLNKNDSKNYNFSNEIYYKLISIYPKLIETLDKYFLKYENEYTKSEKTKLVKQVLLSICKELALKSKIYEDKIFYSLLKQELLKTIQLVLINQHNFRLNSYFILEPCNVYSLYLLQKYQKYIANYMKNKHECENNLDYELLLVNNIGRSLKSSLILFSTGDDVHGVSILRGTLELLARFRSLNDENIENYKLHIKLNSKLQYNKIHGYRLAEGSSELEQLIEDKNLHGGALEQYLLNGWCKNEYGNPITSTSEIIRHAFNSEMVNFYNHASEFVHEDYIGVDYDYVFIRSQCKQIINLLTEELYLFLIKHINLFTNNDTIVHQYLRNSIKKT